MLAASHELNIDEDSNLAFELEVDRGNLSVHIKYARSISLTSEQVQLFILLYWFNYSL